jgi:hypothetical protein
MLDKKYRVTHKSENSITWYYENSLIFSIWDNLEFSEYRYCKNVMRWVNWLYKAKHICNARIRFANAFWKSIKVTEDTIKNKEIMTMARDYLQVMNLWKDEDYESSENDNLWK